VKGGDLLAYFEGFYKEYLQDLLENLKTDQIKLPKSGNQIEE
jgi:hypothetical protein